MKNKIFNLPAGEELDKMVAIKVMGWKWVTRPPSVPQWSPIDGMPAIRRYLIPPDETKRKYIPSMMSPFRIPKYSSDISAAWKVVEKMGAYKLEIVYRSNETKHKATFWHEMMGYPVEAETAPLAICRAALLTVKK
jgi:hypothetical protein